MKAIRVHELGGADKLTLEEIEKPTPVLDVRRQLLMQLAHPGGGRGGDDDLEIRHPHFQRGNQLRRHVHLAHADGVNPEHMAVRHRLLDLGAELPEALGKALLPVAPPPHANEVIRRAQAKEDDEQEIVDQPHCLRVTGSARIRPETCAAGKIKPDERQDLQREPALRGGGAALGSGFFLKAERRSQ